MARISLPVDMNDVDVTANFKVAAPGTYVLEIETVEEKLSQAKQPKLDIRMQIVDDPEFAGVKVFETCSLQPQALFRLKQLALACGIDIGMEFDTEDFLGARFQAVLDIDTYTGKDNEEKTRNVIKKYEF